MMVRTATSLLLLSLLSGCGIWGSNTNLKVELDELTKDVRGKVVPLPQVKPYEPFPYAASHLRDPFKPATIRIISTEMGRFKSEMNRPKQPLESYPLEAVKMVGTLDRSADGITALVRGEGRLFHVKVGQYIGQNHGLVRSISKGAIELREIVQIGSSGWEERTATLKLEETQERK